MRATQGRPTRRRRSERMTLAGPTPMETAGIAGASVGTGVAIEYFLDPDRGRSRRARARDQAARAVRRANNACAVLVRDLSNRSRGLAATARYRSRDGDVDDDVLEQRVRETIGRHVGHPHAVEVSADGGVVTLRGDVLRREAKRAAAAVRRVPGVRDVKAEWDAHQSGDGIPQLQGPGRSRQPKPGLLQQHWSPSARLVATSGAAAAWASSQRLPQPLRWTLRGAGSVLAFRAVTNLPLKRITGVTAGRRAIDVQAAISIDAPPEQVWPVVSDYASFPEFMPDVHEVSPAGDSRRSHWEVAGPAGSRVRFDAEETKREEGRELAWRTVDGQLVAHAGAIRVDPENGGRSRVQVQFSYNPVAGAVGHAIASILGANPTRKVQQSLQRLQAVLENKIPSKPQRAGV